VKEFVACIRQNQPPKIAADVHAGRAATVLALTAIDSIRSGQPQDIVL
jgi:hypothetical protein